MLPGGATIQSHSENVKPKIITSIITKTVSRQMVKMSEKATVRIPKDLAGY